MADQSAGSVGNMAMAKCRGACRQMKPIAGLGSDGRCLDCRLAPLQNYVPPLSASKRLKRAGISWMEHQRMLDEGQR
jgi:hypothetical protein